MSEDKPKTGDYRLIPEGTSVYSICLQQMISFPEDEMIVELNYPPNTDTPYFYGKLKVVVKEPTEIGPAIKYVDKYNGDIIINVEKTKSYHKIETFTV